MSNLDSLFPGFTAHWVDGAVGKIFARVGGEGPPVVLIHGFPQTHAEWHRIAGELAKTHTVVCPDLRGYGWSAAPHGDGGKQTYTKRGMGDDIERDAAVLGDIGEEPRPCGGGRRIDSIHPRIGDEPHA